MFLKQMSTLVIFSIAVTLNVHAEKSLNIIYTNDLEGTVATCGCAVDPGGGVERRINWYKKNNFSPVDTIYINSGSTLFSGSANMDYEAESLKIGAGIMADSLIAMNIDAYAPGAFDLKMGKDFFKTTTKKLPVLITNSKDSSFLKEVKLKRGGLDIKIFGITTEAKGFQTYDPVKALKKYTDKKDKKSFYILLADTNKKNLDAILKNVKNLDVIISSSIDEQLTTPEKAGNTVVVRLLKGGDSIGLLSKENHVVFLGSSYSKENEFTDRIKKYEGLQNTTTPKVKDDF